MMRRKLPQILMAAGLVVSTHRLIACSDDSTGTASPSVDAATSPPTQDKDVVTPQPAVEDSSAPDAQVADASPSDASVSDASSDASTSDAETPQDSGTETPDSGQDAGTVVPAAVAITAPVAGTIVYAETSSATYAVSGTCNRAGASVSVKVNTVDAATATCNGSSFATSVNTGAAPFVDGSNSLVAMMEDAAGQSSVSSHLVTVHRDLSALAVTITSHSNLGGERGATDADSSVITVDSPTVSGTCAPAGRTINLSLGSATASVQCSLANGFAAVVNGSALADFTNYKLRATIVGSSGATATASVNTFKAKSPSVSFAEVSKVFTEPVAGNTRVCVDCHYIKTPVIGGTPSSNFSFGHWDSCFSLGGGKPTGVSAACEDPSNSATYATCDDPNQSTSCKAERDAFRFRFGYFSYTSTSPDVGYANRVLSIVNDDVDAPASLPVLNRVVRGKPNQSFLYKKISGRVTSASVSAANPAVITAAAHGFRPGDAVRFTAGTLPTGLVTTTIYYVRSAGFGLDSFQVSATPEGAAVSTASGVAASGIAISAQDACIHSFGNVAATGCRTGQSAGSRMPILTTGRVTNFLPPEKVQLVRDWISQGARTDF